MIEAGTIVEFVTTAPQPALRTGFVVSIDDNGWATVGVTSTMRSTGVGRYETQRHNIPRTFTVPVSELKEVE